MSRPGCSLIFISKSFNKNITSLLFPGESSLSNQKDIDIFLFLRESIWCDNSLEAPHWGAPYESAFNEYPQHIFSWSNKKNIYLISLLSGAMTNSQSIYFMASDFFCLAKKKPKKQRKKKKNIFVN